MDHEEEFAKSVARQLVRKDIKKAMVEMAGMVMSLMRRVQKLERSIPKYKGVWHCDEKYLPGSMVTHDGSLFHCNEETTDRPGRGGPWTLCAKRGANGKDARP